MSGRLDGESRRFVETSCVECVVDIHGWREPWHERAAFVFVSCLSNHAYHGRYSWRGKVALIKEAFRSGPCQVLEFVTPDEVNEFIVRLLEVRDTIWPAKV